MIQCRVLGPPDLTVEGGAPPAELLWRKNLALLVYLALSPRRTRARDHLIGLLWSDKPESAARHSLNEALRVLRRAVGDDGIISDPTTVRLGDGAIELDTEAFATHESEGRWAEAAILAGGEFLEGFAVPGASGFEDWMAAERSAWRRRAVSALVRAAEAALGRARTGEACGLAERAVALDPASSAGQLALLRALAVAGDRAGALRRFAEYASLVRDQVGTAPDPEVSALAERIRRERIPPPVDSQRTETPSRRLPLVDRDGPMTIGLEAWRSARLEHRTAIFLITAGAGLGKTRLAEELMARARLDGAATLAVRGVAADREAPWNGIIGLARGGLLSTSGIAAATPAAHAAFAERIPEWADRFPGSRGAQPAPLGSAFVEVIRAAAEEQPLVILADDAHMIDRESVLALEQLSRDLPTAPLLILLAAEPTPPREELDVLSARLGRDAHGASIVLEPLAQSGIRALAAAAFPKYDDAELDRLTRRVATDSAGLPLLAVEILNAVASGLDLRGTTGAWPEPFHTLTQTTPGGLPDTVVAAIRVGFRRLPAEAQTVLGAAAALGGRVTARTLASATGLSPVVTDGALDELEWQRWLVADVQGYSFVAAIVAQVVEMDMITPGQRRRFRDASTAGEGA
ncbi:MAG TPA: AAA family ATPase [Gemmatimonadales bacterium]|nr:AAA family ATPase [Gemmatimonadales bacterium]